MVTAVLLYRRAKNDFHFFCGSSKSGSRAKLMWCPSNKNGVTYFAWDPLQSYFSEPQKNEIYFLKRQVRNISFLIKVNAFWQYTCFFSVSGKFKGSPNISENICFSLNANSNTTARFYSPLVPLLKKKSETAFWNNDRINNGLLNTDLFLENKGTHHSIFIYYKIMLGIWFKFPFVSSIFY